MYCWAKPLNSRSFHIFYGGRSLCLRWMFFGADDPVGEGEQTARAGDCKECVKRINAARAVKPPKG